jgi:MFS family permease
MLGRTLLMMKDILRNTAAAMAGAFTGIVLIALGQLASARVYPLPEGVDPANREAMGEFIRNLPAPAMLLVLGGYMIGVAGGAWVAGRLSATVPRRQVFMVTAVFLIASVMNLTAFPHPIWFWATNLGAVIAGGWIALRMQPNRGV